MKLMDVALHLVYIATYSIIIPIGAGIYFLKALTSPLKIFLVGLGIVFFLDLLLLFFNLKTANTIVYIFTAVDVLTMAWVYSLVINRKTVSKAIIIIGFVFIPCIAVDAFFISGLTNKGYINAIERVFVLIIAIYYMTQLFQEDIESDLLKQPMFWISAGVIAFNLVGSFEIFSGPIANYSQNLYLQYYMLCSIIILFMHGCFAYAFWLCKPNF